MAGDFLKELPSFNKDNFSKFKIDDHHSKSGSRPVTYIQTKDTEDEKAQVIVTDKTNILLRYLRHQLHKENKHQTKRSIIPSMDTTLSPSPKVARLDTTVDDNG